MVILSVILSAFIMPGCDSSPRPDSLEPEIETFDATEIMRTEATLSARVQNRSSSVFTRLVFRYGENGKADKEVSVTEAGAETHTLRLTNLTPNTEYTWYVEGGTKTAVVRSQTRTFITQPNELPSLTGFTPLSTGPTGVILSFEITDDGGEPLISAGCDVFCPATATSSRILLTPEFLSTGRKQVFVTGLTVETQYTLTPFATNSMGEAKGEPLEYTTRPGIVLEKAGSLARLFGNDPGVRLSMLTITGDMNGDDFKFLRAVLDAPVNWPANTWDSHVEVVDLSDVNIVAGGDSYDGARFTSENEITTGLFSDCIRLKSIILPFTASVIARDAFARCRNLESIVVSAGINSILPSAECESLQAIEVSAANSNFSSIDGVLFNHDATEILWFPLGKTGDYTLPTRITSLGENCFYGTSITGLNIPQTVTEINRGAFAGSALRFISLPDNIRKISEGMFQNCSTLTTLRLGIDTEYIGGYAFDGTALESLYVGATIPPVAAENAFTNSLYSLFEGCILYVPAGSKGIYRNNRTWGQFKKIEEY